MTKFKDKHNGIIGVFFQRLVNKKSPENRAFKIFKIFFIEVGS